MVTIIPAILATNITEFSEQLDKLKSTPELEGGWVHIDFMDGEFVENKSIDPDVLKKFEIPFKKEAHLMVKHPSEIIHKLINQKFDRIMIHIESEHPNDTSDPWKNKITSDLNDIEDYSLDEPNIGLESGVVINPETDVNELSPYLYDVDLVQIMAVNPGEQGQEFIQKTIERVQDVAFLRDKLELNLKISVDGGVNETNVRQLIEAGADILVIGSYLQKGDIDENLEKIWEIIG